MPLSEMSPNIGEADSPSRKRSHDEFAAEVIKPVKTDLPILPSPIHPATEDLLRDIDSDSDLSSPPSSPGLTTADSSTPTRISPYPLTPTKTSSNPSDSKPKRSPASSATANPVVKRKRLTASEKEAKEKEMAEKKKEKEKEMLEKKKEKEEKASAKAAEKAKQEEEKAARMKEREEKRKQKEEEERAKAEQRDEKRRKKEEEQQRIQDEKDRKARSQKTLNSFFKAPSISKRPAGDASVTNSPSKEPAASPSKPTMTPYQKLFQPFFVKESMRMASTNQHLDDDTRQAKSQALEKDISNEEKKFEKLPPFRPRELFGLPTTNPRRGRQYYPVKNIMETVYRQTGASSNAGVTDVSIIARAKEKLSTVPVKVIAFSQDVRPPYYGTITYQPYALGRQHMRSLARKPVKRVLPLDYDFDSEAEWQEEDGEDVDMDDDEEELDSEDDMEGFLDDSEDAGLTRRIFANNIEPETTGICFENSDRVGPSDVACLHKMELMHERIESGSSINPWVTEYWEVEVAKPKLSKVNPVEKAAKMPPPPAPSNAFEALKTSSTGAASAPEKLVKAELMHELKQTVLDNKALSKAGIIDFVFQKFKGRASRSEVINTIAHVAERTGTGRAKEWTLKEGHGIDA